MVFTGDDNEAEEYILQFIVVAKDDIEAEKYLLQ